MLFGLSIWAWIGMLGFVACGAAVWFGWWRSWVDHPRLQYYAWRMPCAPWIGMMFAMMIVLGILRNMGISLPQKMMAAALLPWAAIGFSVMVFHWPRWALPPWYRKLMLERNGPPPPRPWWLKWIDW
ncbi:MAG: hypothetical protein EPO21_04895 [Chloroflexota bacterium]|nr:MAG: hypothetical protein EPO21_04895 [Chloroflexota bacterium]